MHVPSSHVKECSRFQKQCRHINSLFRSWVRSRAFEFESYMSETSEDRAPQSREN